MIDSVKSPTRRHLLSISSALFATAAFPSFAASTINPSVIPTGLTGVNVSLLSSALSEIGLNPRKHAMTTDIKPLVSIGQTMLGPAVTTKWETGQGDGIKEKIRRFVFDPLDQASAGSVWVVASGTDQIYSMFGDIVALACQRNGMAGAVTDSGCRDIEAIEAMGFPVFAKATVPYGPGKFIQPVGANVPVICGGVEVHPGDLVAADIDGVIVIPKDSVPEVTEAVAAHRKKEQEARRMLDSGETLRKSYPL